MRRQPPCQQLCFRLCQQPRGDARTLPALSDRHAPEMAFFAASHAASRCAGDLLPVDYGNEDRHGLHALVESSRGKHRIQKGFSRVA